MKTITTDTIIRVARQAAEEYIKTGQASPPPTGISGVLAEQKACFVSILENPGRNFRSMHGTALPRHSNVGQEIVANTLAAIDSSPGSRLRPPDLSYLSYVVAILGPLERITSQHHLDPSRLGLYVRSDQGRTGLLLPGRTGIDSPADQIATIMRESNINVRQEATTMYRFTVEYHE